MVVTESVFNLPGVGRLTVDAVLARDYPVIQAVILLASLVYVVVNLLIDIAYVFLDSADPLPMSTQVAPNSGSAIAHGAASPGRLFQPDRGVRIADGCC